MKTEEKAKAYDEALNWMRELYPGLHGATKEDAEHYFPELRESEDEQTRKQLIDFISNIKAISESGRSSWAVRKDDAEMCNAFLTYLEKQKEQKTSEWSKEFLRLMGITVSQDGNQVCVLLGENLAEGIAGFGDTLADAVEEFKKEWRQFERFRKATWKPSEEQMRFLWRLEGELRADNHPVAARNLAELCNDLEKL